MELTKEDREKIDNLAKEIISKAASLTYENFIRERPFFEKAHVGVNMESEEFLGRKKADQFSFYSKNEVGLALYKFCADPYVAKHIAKVIYTNDEDDRFSEELDIGIPLGRVMLPNGAIMETSVVQFRIKARSLYGGYRNPNYGMPFDIMLLRLVD